MSEKQFTFVCDDESCYFKDDKRALTCLEVVDLLNELYDENEQLRQTVQHLEEECGARENDIDTYMKTIKTQQVRIYCQDKQIQTLQNQLNKIPPNIKEVWLE